LAVFEYYQAEWKRLIIETIDLYRYLDTLVYPWFSNQFKIAAPQTLLKVTLKYFES